MKNVGLLVFTTAMLFICGTAHATIWYVHPDSILNSIQAGLDSCADHDTVLVAPGVYHENIAWPYTQGIDLVSESVPATTIIDGDSAESVITIPTFTYLDSTSRIDGFTIQNGHSFWSGGIYCQIFSGRPIITNNIITANSAILGGGISSSHSACPFIIGNTITANSALLAGGIYCFSEGATIIGNIIADNSGQGIIMEDEASPTITGNTISNNSGVGIGVDELCTPPISNNIITHNGSYGILAIDASPAIHNCVISYNGGDGILHNYGMKRSVGRALSISYSDIFGNAGYGLRNLDSTLVIVAENNWWGDVSGPYHPSSNPGGLGDSISDFVDFDPWLFAPYGIAEQPIIKTVENSSVIRSTIFRGPLQLPEGKKCKVFDITGRVVEPTRITRGIYFIEVDGVVTQKVLKVR